jgi:hypothetical protein
METTLVHKGKNKAGVATVPINTIQQMWDTAVADQKNSVFDTDAMRAIFKAMNPRLTYQDIANVFSGVYADSYWNITFLDPAALSKSMQSALALSKDQADKYAGNAVSQWRGILCRKNINDTGRIPVQGDYTGSLDIVCNRDTELAPTDLIENWNSVYWQTPQVGKNYVYLRCQNAAFLNDIDTQTVNMFYTSGGFNQPPTAWQQLFTAKSGSTNGKVVQESGSSGPMGNGARGASESFFFNPTSTDHVCLIGTVTTEFFSNPLDISQGNWNSYTWITHNGAAAWHNVDPQHSVQEKLFFYNQDGSSEEFSFVASCRNVPKGSKIGLKSADSRLLFDSGLIEISKLSQQVAHSVVVPPYYKGQLIVTLEGPDGKLLPRQSAVEVSMVWNLKKGHKHYTDAAEKLNALQKFANGENIEVPMGSYTFLGSKG